MKAEPMNIRARFYWLREGNRWLMRLRRLRNRQNRVERMQRRCGLCGPWWRLMKLRWRVMDERERASGMLRYCLEQCERSRRGKPVYEHKEQR